MTSKEQNNIIESGKFRLSLIENKKFRLELKDGPFSDGRFEFIDTMDLTKRDLKILSSILDAANYTWRLDKK